MKTYKIIRTYPDGRQEFVTYWHDAPSKPTGFDDPSWYSWARQFCALVSVYDRADQVACGYEAVEV